MTYEKVFFFPDIHWSERDERALSVALQAWYKFHPDHTVVGGDLLNVGPLSRHARIRLDEDPGYDYVESDLKPARDFLVGLTRQSKVTLLEGNHDDRLERWMLRTEGGGSFKSLLPSRYLGRLPGVTYLQFSGDNWRKQHLRLSPRLAVVHGWTAGKAALDRHLEWAKPISIVFFHTHRLAQKSIRLYDGSAQTAVNGGCLCKLQPVYAHNGSPQDWSHGFVQGYISKKNHHLFPVEITPNYTTVTPEGRLFSG